MVPPLYFGRLTRSDNYSLHFLNEDLDFVFTWFEVFLDEESRDLVFW